MELIQVTFWDEKSRKAQRIIMTRGSLVDFVEGHEVLMVDPIEPAREVEFLTAT